MLERLEAHSARTPYAPLTARLKAHTRRSVTQRKRSLPHVITGVLLKAVKAKNPKRRYVAGRYTRLLLFFRRFLGDAFLMSLCCEPLDGAARTLLAHVTNASLFCVIGLKKTREILP
ncbi:MAG: hypothetical protein H2057_04125 [Alphaproteobacteria bacterium]|nr:hypothetical protein [Alphaproteobacteria bacterium]